jgi:hypothetical protein
MTSEFRGFKPEKVKDIGCSFKVFRKTRSDKVISLSLWKGSPGYVFNLSNTILWWGRNVKVLYPGFNVRIYVDYSIFRQMRDDVDWRAIFNQLLKHNNVEVWLSFCEWGHKKTDKCRLCHTGTFSSLLRFHAMQDPTVKVAVIRNVEMLSNSKEARIVWDWMHSRKTYHVFYDIYQGYSCGYGDEALCRKLGLDRTNMVLAWFGLQGKNPYPNMFNTIRKMLFKKQSLSKFPYGVDEIVLTWLFKPLMTNRNTYITPRARLNQFIPTDNPLYNNVWNHVFDFFKNIKKIVLPDQQRFLDRIFRDGEVYDEYIDYQPRRNLELAVHISRLDKAPDIAVLLLRYLKVKLRPETRPLRERADLIHRALQSFYFKMFHTNGIQRDTELRDNQAANFYEQVPTEEDANLLVFISIFAVIFEGIDFAGLTVKTKNFTTQRPPSTRITEEDILEEMQTEQAVRKRRRKYNKRLGVLSDAELREHAITKLRRNAEKKSSDYRKNKEIFLRNIKNIYMMNDKPYV